MQGGCLRRRDDSDDGVRTSGGKGMRLIVCGGRDFIDAEKAFAALDRAHAKRPITEIIQGGASGADTLAKRWAAERGIPCTEVRANWQVHGRAAGPLRNGDMLDLRPDGVIALQGGRGTADMRKQAAARGIPVWEPLG